LVIPTQNLSLKLTISLAPFTRAGSPRTETKSTAAEKKIETLESRLKRKDEVIAEIMEDFIRAKKQIGES
jgi:hypothetical protein